MEVKGSTLNLPRTIYTVLDTASVFKTDEFSSMIDITIDQRKIKIASESETGAFEDSLNINYNGSKIQFRIEANLLMEILKNIGNRTVIIGEERLKFSGENWECISTYK